MKFLHDRIRSLDFQSVTFLREGYDVEATVAGRHKHGETQPTPPQTPPRHPKTPPLPTPTPTPGKTFARSSAQCPPVDEEHGELQLRPRSPVA
jgi:hypothetical protein